MRRKVLIVGIGAGNPDFVTVQAINVHGHVTLFFIPDHGAANGPGRRMKDPARLRAEILELYVRNRPFRTTSYKEPLRKDDGMEPQGDIRHAGLSFQEMDASECGAFLVRSGFSLTETVGRVLQRLRSSGDFELDYEVIPGNSGIQVLTTAHKVALCNVGRSILTATGRSLAGGFPNNADTIVFMLPAVPVQDTVSGHNDVHWTLYAGMPDDMLVSGRLREIVGGIEQVRNAALDGKGWVVEAMLRQKGAHGS
ncbi:MAG TPA: SAM-dependent methyltransferase [Mesorhizobium sp.]|jgi:precorrin-6A synthase|uniref:SAM-dependent methyltransferase n=1 Tax=Mesorhizobium sp. TaxID=1871066 RepID=UPI002DDCF14D|nr:SAM-dependent methyltransferase [Mesorhizobium sp.]HEV2503610.1 SAM-dependent methyltransferase [Mesorhizobium sp.]